MKNFLVKISCVTALSLGIAMAASVESHAQTVGKSAPGTTAEANPYSPPGYIIISGSGTDDDPFYVVKDPKYQGRQFLHWEDDEYGQQHIYYSSGYGGSHLYYLHI